MLIRSICVAIILGLYSPVGIAADISADDTKINIEKLRAAAEQGDAEAQIELGVTYLDDSAPKEPAEALKWFRKSAAQGNAGAQYLLGWMYADGNGVPQDYTEAAKWYGKGAAQGHVNSQYNLGLLYIDGHGVPKDYVKAYMSLAIAVAYSVPNAEMLMKKIEPMMTQEQMTEGKRLAGQWMKQHPN